MSMFGVLGYGTRRGALAVADRIVTHPLFAWTWSGSAGTRYSARLAEFRPSDGLTVDEMMEGKYLLAGYRVDTGGVSPFAIDSDSPDWYRDLHSFGWLRHFSSVSDPGQRAFARTLVGDWMARFKRFERDAWDVFITARRVLNWLKAYALLTDDAPPEQVRALSRSIAVQIHSLKTRARLSADPAARLMASVALVGAALSELDDSGELETLVRQLESLLATTTDDDGLIRSRNPHIQLQLLTELIPVSHALAQRRRQLSGEIARQIEAMHRAFDRLVLGTREPAYFHGCGQIPVELVLAVSSQSGARTAGSGLSGGYGILVDGAGKLVADGGAVPPPAFARVAHASALAFEYAYGSTLIVGNCGPAPGQLDESRDLFRHTSAHSAPTIDETSSARIGPGGVLRQRGSGPSLTFDAGDNALEMATDAFADRYGLAIMRRVSLIGAGQTLVGQDRFVAAKSRRRQQGAFSIRFHLAPGVSIDRREGGDLIRMIHRNGEVWSFLWEGAEADIEDSVRHSAHFGLNRTRQIVLHGIAAEGAEIAWVFTKQT